MHSWPFPCLLQASVLVPTPIAGKQHCSWSERAHREIFCRSCQFLTGGNHLESYPLNRLCFPRVLNSSEVFLGKVWDTVDFTSWCGHSHVWTWKVDILGLKPLPRGPLFLKAMSHGEHVSFDWSRPVMGETLDGRSFFFLNIHPFIHNWSIPYLFEHLVEIASSPNFRAFFGHPSKEIFGKEL